LATITCSQEIPSNMLFNYTHSVSNIWDRWHHRWLCISSQPARLSDVIPLKHWGIQEVPHMNKDSLPATDFLLFFIEVIQLLVTKTKKYYNQYLHTCDNDGRCSWLPDMTVQEMYILLAMIKMWHDVNNILKSYWSTTEQFFTPF